MAPRENSGDKKVDQKGLFKSVNLKNAIRVRHKLEGRTLQETSQQERCARREAWDLAKNVHKLKKTDKATFYSPIEARGKKFRG